MHRDLENKEAGIFARCFRSGVGRIVEIGCGNGRLTCHLEKHAESVLGLDPCQADLDLARQCVGDAVQLAVGSGEEIPLEDGVCDAVVFTLSLHHQDSPRALKEAARTLNANGRILVIEPKANTLGASLFAVIDDESHRYVIAEAAIQDSVLKVVDYGDVLIQWTFQDYNEMVEYIFGYYGLKPDPKREPAMAALADARKNDIPLFIEDETRFWLLEP
ncbi:Methyltransferase domain-containing protein [Desulfatibacillum alkenivorans DSM 16219]|uniref:Methyltransferase domain-containing protein n=2 Tax=Desulfatibacillum alkenivorans TaxID=259354 RepID=A0A1M6J9S4_9BACT|nr:class I SAM-dependent methyltransferase [Desulfatibacillum alkenivorans]SHJ43400.1 Methyltransferase domain-containing protein [Desulfatibacillum alkenivorans DSM 16219]